MNTKIFSIILAINSFSGGILVPILSLLFLQKGLNLAEISIVVGLYSLSIIIFEIPTGIASDFLGRKKMFCLALISSIISAFIMLFCKGIINLALAMVFHGISRALSSGSLHALYIEWNTNDKHSKEKLAKVMTKISLLETLGLALGSILGGVIPSLVKSYISELGIYDLNIIIKIILTVIVFVMSWLFIKEYDLSVKKENISLINQVKSSIEIVKNNRLLIIVFISVFSTGFFLFSLETYWQPRLVSLLSKDISWIIGVVSGIYYGASIYGNIIAEKIISNNKINTQSLYIISRIVLVIALIIMAIQKNVLSFVVLYAIVYFSFGICNIPEGVIINSEVSNRSRATILSFNSLVLQIGSLVASLVASITINYISISILWIISSFIILIPIIVLISENKKLKDLKNRYN